MSTQSLRLATWNIHKGVRGIGGLGRGQRLEVHAIARAMPLFHADIICLQEVRNIDHSHAKRFTHWPTEPQADFLAPHGFTAVYHSNAFNRHGEHGNALLTRLPVLHSQQHDVSDHALEQRGLLHVCLDADGTDLHIIVVHLGLLAKSRMRQIEMLRLFIAQEVPAHAKVVVAGDFNDWGERLHIPLERMGLHAALGARFKTFPARAPVLALDRMYGRGVQLEHTHVPQGKTWWDMSDHLPLVGQVSW